MVSYWENIFIGIVGVFAFLFLKGGEAGMEIV